MEILEIILQMSLEVLADILEVLTGILKAPLGVLAMILPVTLVALLDTGSPGRKPASSIGTTGIHSVSKSSGSSDRDSKSRSSAGSGRSTLALEVL